MIDPDGLAFLLIFALAGLAALLIALLVERHQRRHLREFLRRERARIAWQASVIESQHFWKKQP